MLSTLDAARQIPDSKLLTRSIYDILTQSSNDLQCFVGSSVDSYYVTATTWLNVNGLIYFQDLR